MEEERQAVRLRRVLPVRSTLPFTERLSRGMSGAYPSKRMVVSRSVVVKDAMMTSTTLSPDMDKDTVENFDEIPNTEKSEYDEMSIGKLMASLDVKIINEETEEKSKKKKREREIPKEKISDDETPVSQ